MYNSMIPLDTPEYPKYVVVREEVLKAYNVEIKRLKKLRYQVVREVTSIDRECFTALLVRRN